MQNFDYKIIVASSIIAPPRFVLASAAGGFVLCALKFLRVNFERSGQGFDFIGSGFDAPFKQANSMLGNAAQGRKLNLG